MVPEVCNAVVAVHARLLAWDLSKVKRHAVKAGLFSADEIDAVEAEYKKWLALAVTSNDGIPISTEIDPLWHEHIIFTQDYTDMGKTIAGRYIHHRPAILDDEKELARQFSARTLSLYEEHFGTPNPKYWGSVVCRCTGGDCNEISLQ